MGLTALEVLELRRLRRDCGTMSVSEYLELALESEVLRDQCGPHDIAFAYLCRQETQLFRLAYLTEKELS